MIKAGIRDTKNNLSRYLAKVKAGEEVIITERGRPVARIIREDQGSRSIRAALSPLIERGLIALPSRRLEKEKLLTLQASGKSVSEMVIEDRR
jgi:prevent-host-death family protein